MKSIKYILLALITLLVIDLSADITPRKKKKRKKKVKEEEVVVPKIKKLSDKELEEFNFSFAEGLRAKSLGQVSKASIFFLKCLTIDSTSAVCYYELAKFALSSMNLNEALELARKSVFFNPKNKWYLLQLAQIYQGKSMISHAANVYDKLKKLEPDNLKHYYTKASLLTSVEEWNNAIAEFNQIEAQFGIIPNISLQKLKLFDKIDRRDLAYQEAEKLTRKYPENVDFIGLLADMYNEDSKPEMAYEQYQKILQKDPNNGLVHFFLSDYYFKKDDTDKALEEFELGLMNKEVDPSLKMQRIVALGKDTIDSKKMLDLAEKFVKQNPEILMGHLFYAYYLKEENKTEEAKKELLLVLEKDSLNYNALQQLSMVYLNLKNYDTLKVFTEKGIRNFSGDPWFYLFNGLANMYLEDYEAAEKSLLKGKQFTFNDDELLTQFNSNLADNYYKMGKKEKAFSLYEQVLLYDPKNIHVLNNYSYYLSLEKQKLTMAERMSKICIDKEPNNATYLDTYAWILYASGNYEEAKIFMEKAVENMEEDNQSGVILEHYGDILFKLGDKEKALEFWEKGFEIGSDDNDLLQEKINSKVLIEKD